MFAEIFHKVYPGLKFDIPALSKKFKIKTSVLHKVYGRGAQASGRFGQNPYSWGIARVYKFILVKNKKIPMPNKFSNSNLTR